MDSEKTKRKSLRQSFTVCANNAKTALGNADTTVTELCSLQKQLLDKYSRLEEVQETVAQSLLSDPLKTNEYETDFETAEKYRDTFSDITTQLEARINMAAAPSESGRDSMAEKRNFKLPRLELKKFTGEPKEYLAFWSQFRKIHSDETIPNEDKFQYLIQCVVPRSKAARLVDSYPPTGDNYPKCIRQLQLRFGRDDLLVQIYVRDLLGLVMKNASGRGKPDLAELYDLLESKLLALESLGRTKEKFADFLEPLVESCLPESVLRAWERSRSVDGAAPPSPLAERGETEEADESALSEGSSLRSLERLMTFLRAEVHSEEMILLARSGLGTSPHKVLHDRDRKTEEHSLPTNAVLVNTGGAGVIGALSYASLTAVFSIRVTLQIMLIMPVLTAVTFWVLIEHPTSLKISCRENFCYSEREPILDHGIDLSVKPVVKRKTYTFNEKISLIKPLLKYMIPLGLVYFAEYFINQGLMELLYFPNESSWLPHAKQYRWYQVIYQFGVLISRSSVNIFQVHKLWILPILQFVNLVVLLVDVPFVFIPSIWIVFAIILYEGLLGGCAYVNTFYKISSEIPEEDREFSMGIASLGDAIGIALAGAISLPVHDALCKLQ